MAGDHREPDDQHAGRRRGEQWPQTAHAPTAVVAVEPDQLDQVPVVGVLRPVDTDIAVGPPDVVRSSEVGEQAGAQLTLEPGRRFGVDVVERPPHRMVVDAHDTISRLLRASAWRARTRSDSVACTDLPSTLAISSTGRSSR